MSSSSSVVSLPSSSSSSLFPEQPHSSSQQQQLTTTRKSSSSNDFVKLFSQLERVARNLSNIWPRLGFNRNNGQLSRQIFDMVDIVTDVAMLTIIGIPILGMVALGATALQPLLGVTPASSRKKRSILEDILNPTATYANGSNSNDGILKRASRAMLYARNLYDIVAQLEATFEEYDIRSNDCQLRAICEVHKVGPNSDYKDFGEKIIDIVNLEREVEEYETIPLGKLFFQVYADAARYGKEVADCSTLYPRCETDIATLVLSKLSKKNGEQEEVVIDELTTPSTTSTTTTRDEIPIV